MEHVRIPPERRVLWTAVLLLCGIAIAVSIRRLVALADPSATGKSPLAALDALFAARAGLTRTHVVAGLLLALFIPVQLSTRVRRRFPHLHRWLGRTLMIVGIVVGVSGYAMVVTPIGGVIEMSAIVFYGTALLVCLLTAWRYIRRGDVAQHREWILRALAIVLGIATTRPVVGAFFATSPFTQLSPSQFFGAAFWIGFTSTAIAGEWYVRTTRPFRDGWGTSR
jgi:uncharacterized membrane protein